MSSLIGLPGQMAVTSGSASNIPGGTSGSGGAGPVTVVSGNFALTAATNGTAYYDNTTSSNTGTVPSGLPIGYAFKFIADKASGNLVIQFSGTETASYAGGSTSAAGALTWAGAAQGAITLQKVTATRWFTIAAAGSAATPS